MSLFKKMKLQLFKNLFLVIRKPFLSSKLLTRLLFNVDLSFETKEKTVKFYFDLTTLVMRNALLKYARDGQRILEIGTGEFCILPIFLARRRNVEITAVDINPHNVAHSRKVATHNAMPRIVINESDITSSVEGSFDIIFWNLPYVPTHFGEAFYKLEGEEKTSAGWHGGKTGMETFKKFLKQAPACLKTNGMIIAGLNTYFIPLIEIERMVKDNGFKIKEVCASFCNPSKAIVISKNDKN